VVDKALVVSLELCDGPTAEVDWIFCVVELVTVVPEVPANGIAEILCVLVAIWVDEAV